MSNPQTTTTTTTTLSQQSDSTPTTTSIQLPPSRFISPTISITTLTHTTHVPIMGIGTFRLQGTVCQDVVMEALRVGYRRIDTAQVYFNESTLGSFLPSISLPRSSLFITSKLHPRRASSYDAVLEACRNSVKELGMGYVDLYLIHWPGMAGVAHNSPRHVEYRRWSWLALEQLVREGLVHHIGVSNYTSAHIIELMTATWRTIDPVWNQIEIHPMNYSAQRDVIATCHKYNIVVEAYSSLGQGDTRLIQHQGIRDIANACHVDHHTKQRTSSETSTSTSASTSSATSTSATPAQVLLAWGLQHGFPVIPRTSNPGRVLENALSLYVHLTDQHMHDLDEWSEKQAVKFAWDPQTVT